MWPKACRAYCVECYGLLVKGNDGVIRWASSDVLGKKFSLNTFQVKIARFYQDADGQPKMLSNPTTSVRSQFSSFTIDGHSTQSEQFIFKHHWALLIWPTC